MIRPARPTLAEVPLTGLSLTRFQHERAAGFRVREAVSRALATSGPAMVITSITLAAGLTPMLWSPAMPMRIFSQLTIVALARRSSSTW